MRILRSTGFIVVAAVLAACNGPNAASVIGQSGTAGNGSPAYQRAHATVAPGLAGKLALRAGAHRLASHRVHHAFVATRPCTYLTLNLTGDVLLYNKDLSLAGDFGSTSYGWGAAASGNTIYLGTNNGSGNVDLYTPCTDHYTRTLTGLGTGGNPYGIAFARSTKSVYAANWPVGDIEYWANGSTTAVSVVDPNIALPYFVDADSPGNVYVVGYDASFGNENLDECTPNFSSCTTKAQIAGGFPGGVQVDQNETVYLNNQFGTLYSYDCSSSTCNLNGTFVYNNGTNPLDYTGLALDRYNKHTLWAANIYFCGTSICTDAQSQSVPLNSAVLGAATAGVSGNEALGVARFRPDIP